MNPIAFQRKWLANTLKERSASQPHFLDVCALVNHPTPSDLDRIEIHTNFTGTVKRVHAIDLATVTEPASLDLLRRAVFEPGSLRPDTTVQQVTEQASRQVGQIAAGLRQRGADPREAAHFLMQLLFCLFAEDIGILKGAIFSRVVDFGVQYPTHFNEQIEALLRAMAGGEFFNLQAIPHVNGGLFSRVKTFDLTGPELAILAESARLDWSSIEPAIFGTHFERVVEPEVMAPLRREWDAVRTEMDAIRADVEASPTVQKRRNAQARLASVQDAFLGRLAGVTVLDPASGSGNFLYVALDRLLALEKEVIRHGADTSIDRAEKRDPSTPPRYAGAPLRCRSG